MYLENNFHFMRLRVHRAAAVVSSVCPARADIVAGYVERQGTGLTEMRTSALHTDRLVVAIVAAVPKLLARMVLRNPAGFVISLNRGNESEEPLQLKELVNVFPLLNEELHEREVLLDPTVEFSRETTSTGKPSSRSASRTFSGSEWVSNLQRSRATCLVLAMVLEFGKLQPLGH